jgi:hypothetical protein
MKGFVCERTGGDILEVTAVERFRFDILAIILSSLSKAINGRHGESKIFLVNFRALNFKDKKIPQVALIIIIVERC